MKTENAAAPAIEQPAGCSWTSGERRCLYPAPFSHNTLGGPWWCAWHRTCADPVLGARIVAESHQWDGNPESYLEARRKEVYGTGGDNAVVKALKERMKQFADGDRIGIAAFNLTKPMREPGSDESEAA